MKSVEDFSPAALRAARLERELSQADLAKVIGVTVNTVWRWEKGKGVPSSRLFGALVECLDIPRSKLLAPLSPDADLATLRARAGLRQEDVARQLSVQRSDVSEMELGVAPMKPEWAVVLHELYEAPLERLVRAQGVTEARWQARRGSP
ncbi:MULTISPECIES: helix-turn-helix transcriptional regulator [Streptomyces]|uniref:helix-turn-helix transcriptional regulator n=1 Tax=Streptomyces TaxID=1883 RepID=UPI0015590753|nr:helix-turn-helix transcriptional regulator [Streptomyces kasugaensis]